MPTGLLSAYADALAELADAPLRGYLTGSIDAVLRVGAGRPALPRRRLQDQPAGRLRRAADRVALPVGRAGDRDGRGALPVAGAALLRRAAPLPALAAAGLRPRRAPRRLLYLFLRGMSGPGVVDADGAASGVFSWRPPAGLVVGAVRPAGGRCDDRRCRRVESALALRATGLLRDFNRAGILSAADVHVAQRLGRLGGETDEAVLLAVALVVRSTRHGSVVLDLDDRRGDDQPGRRRGRPARGRRRRAGLAGRLGGPVRASPLVGGPLRMRGVAAVAGAVLGPGAAGRRRAAATVGVAARTISTPTVLSAGLDAAVRRRGGRRPAAAAAACALSRVSVLAGGPGTGKTTTVAPAAGAAARAAPGAGGSRWRRRPARRRPGWRRRCGRRRPSCSTADRARLGELPATTLHRLLGWRPEARSRFRHDRTNRLPYEVVVVDEARWCR